MQVTYTNTFFDLIRFNLYHLPRTVSGQVAAAAFVLLHAWTFGPHIVEMNDHVGMKAAVFTTTLLFLLGVLLVVQFVFILLSYRPSKNKTFLTQHVVSVSDEGLVEETAYGATSSTWAGVPKVGQNRTYIFVYVQQNMAHVIPKVAFPSASDAVTFFEFVRSHVGSVRRVDSNVDE
jgi:hypothetical protein